MIARLRDFASNESGIAFTEYALVLALVSLVAYAALYFLGSSLESLFESSSSTLSGVGELAL